MLNPVKSDNYCNSMQNRDRPLVGSQRTPKSLSGQYCNRILTGNILDQTSDPVKMTKFATCCNKLRHSRIAVAHELCPRWCASSRNRAGGWKPGRDAELLPPTAKTGNDERKQRKKLGTPKIGNPKASPSRLSFLDLLACLSHAPRRPHGPTRDPWGAMACEALFLQRRHFPHLRCRPVVLPAHD